MKKYTVLAAAIVMQICLGGIYAWSTFVPSLVTENGLTLTETQLIFGISIAVFTLTMTLAGRLQAVYGPRLVGSVGGILFGVGYLLASFSRGSFPLLFLGIAIVSGMGIGFGYMCPLATSIKWFPQHKGLVTGLAVAGFGGGGVLLSRLASALLQRGISALNIFGGIGVGYGLTILLASQLFLLPERPVAEKDEVGSQRKYSLAELTSDHHFWILALGMFCGTFSGLLVIGNLTPIGLAFGVNSHEVVLAISTFAVGNALGRVTWGWLYDRFGYPSISRCLLMLGFAVALLFLATDVAHGFSAAALVVGFAFGGCFVLFAAQVGSHYGVEAVAYVYPFIFLFYGLAGIVGPPIGGWIFEVTNSFLPALGGSAVVAAFGGIAIGQKR